MSTVSDGSGRLSGIVLPNFTQRDLNVAQLRARQRRLQVHDAPGSVDSGRDLHARARLRASPVRSAESSCRIAVRMAPGLAAASARARSTVTTYSANGR